MRKYIHNKTSILSIIFSICLLFIADMGMAWDNTADGILSSASEGGSFSARQLESRYMREARAYRSQGRYELARQSYAQALSVCTGQKRIANIRAELARMEMLLRTMR